jgi:aspartate racemase
MSELSKERKLGRIIGILGGMGPEATLDLHRDIMSLTPAIKDQDHIWVLIYSNAKIPDRNKAIARTGESPLSMLIESGAKAIILGCTEVPLAFNSHAVEYPTLNPTRILAQAAADWELGERK